MKSTMPLCCLAVLLTLATASSGQALQPAAATPHPQTQGSGLGVHSPLSAFKPLENREGVVPWAILGSVRTRRVDNQLVPVFPETVKAMNQTRVKVQGFMMPLEVGIKQSRFLLSSVPTTCPYCVPAGPEGLIEVRTRRPVSYTAHAITMEGLLQVLSSDDMGLYYRLAEASLTP